MKQANQPQSELETRALQTIGDRAMAESFLEVIARAAADPNVNVEKMERLYAMAKEEKTRIAEQQFNDAMSKAQQEFPPVIRGARNPSTNSNYAKFEHINEVAKPIYSKYGLALIFSEGDTQSANKIRVLCEVRHDGGFSTVKHLDLSPDDTGAKGAPNKTKIHGEGSTFSYGRRYLTVLIFNVSLINEDDDGNQGRQHKGPAPSSAPSDEVRALAVELWNLLKPVRGPKQDWDQINQWLYANGLLDGAAGPLPAAPKLDAATLRAVIAKAKGLL